MSEARFQTDEFLKLLTEALRAGPASPQWHEAVTHLRQINTQEADEYRLLIAAREDLESGREYRSVRAGPGFSRTVLDMIDKEADARQPGLPWARIIAILAALAVVAVVTAVAVIAHRGAGQSGGVGELEKSVFTRPVIGGDFAVGIGAEWRKFGQEPLVSTKEKGLRGGSIPVEQTDYIGGGICAVQPLAADQSFAIEVRLKILRPTAQVDLQLFVTEDPTFDNRTMTPREFVVRLSGQPSGQRIEEQISAFKPDGTAAGEPSRIGAGTVNLLIKLNRQFVVVEHDGKPLYAGPHGLAADKPRWPGVRFLTRGPEKSLDDVTVQSVRVLKP